MWIIMVFVATDSSILSFFRWLLRASWREALFRLRSGSTTRRTRYDIASPLLVTFSYHRVIAVSHCILRLHGIFRFNSARCPLYSLFLDRDDVLHGALVALTRHIYGRPRDLCVALSRTLSAWVGEKEVRRRRRWWVLPDCTVVFETKHCNCRLPCHLALLYRTCNLPARVGYENDEEWNCWAVPSLNIKSFSLSKMGPLD